MHVIYHMRFIESKGYWFNVIQVAEKKFTIFNTKRKKQQHFREGIGYYLPEVEFETLEEVKHYLDDLK